MLKSDLLGVADDLGIDVPSGATKQDVINLIQEV